MRVALFHNVPSGGAKRVIYEWVRRLSVRHQIDVYTLSTADHAFCDVRPFVRRHLVFPFGPRTVFRRPWGRLNPWQRWRDLNELTRIGRVIADRINHGGYSVVLSTTCIHTGIPTFLPFLNCPAVHCLPEPFGRRFRRPLQRPYFRNSAWRQTLDRFDPLIALYNRRLAHLQGNGVHGAKRLLAISRFTQEQMQAGFGRDVAICCGGVNTDEFRPIANIAKRPHVLSVGELTPRKGFDFLIESLGRIPAAERPPLVLACNWVDPREHGYVETLAARNGVQLQSMEQLGTAELSLEYNRARLCVYAPVLEPFGLVPLEAMACGTAVVGVREGGVSESIVHERTGLLVDRDHDQFAAAMQRLLSDPDLAAEYGRNGRQHVLRNWTWEESVASLEAHLVACATEA
ncbi:MAG: glycosyltransferase family 4 protein [Candidatus Binatia bacterium]